MANSEMQDPSSADPPRHEESPEASQASSPEPGGTDGTVADDDLPVEDLMHGDGHAAIPNRPSIDADGSIEIDELTPADFEPDDLRQRLRTMMLSRRLDEKMMTLLKQPGTRPCSRPSAATRAPAKGPATTGFASTTGTCAWPSRSA